VINAITPAAGVSRQVLVSVRSTFADALYAFFHPTDTTSTQQVLTLPLTTAQFPFSNVAGPKIKTITVFFALAQPPAGGTAIAATFSPTGGTAVALSLTTALPAGWTGTPAILSGAAPIAPSAAPRSFTLVVPTASVPAALGALVDGKQRLDPAKIEDVVLVIDYTT